MQFISYSKDEDCWLIFEDKSITRNHDDFPPGEWHGPFRLYVPMLGGKLITVYGKFPEYVQSQQRFMAKKVSPLHKLRL